MPKIVMVDSAPVDVSNPDTAEQVVRGLISARDSATEALDAAQSTLAERDATIAERDAEIARLNDSNKPLTPRELQDAAQAYARTRRQAEQLGVDVTDEMTVDEMQAAAVVSKIGDAAKGYSPEQNAASFAALAANLGDEAADEGNDDPLRRGISDGATVNVSDERKAFEDARNARLERFENAHRNRGTAQ